MGKGLEQLNNNESEHERKDLEFRKDMDREKLKSTLLVEGLSEKEAEECIELAGYIKKADTIVFGEERSAPVFFYFYINRTKEPASFGGVEDSYFVNVKCFQADTGEESGFPHNYVDGLIGGYLDIEEEEFYSKKEKFELQKIAIHEVRHRMQEHREEGKSEEKKFELFKPGKDIKDEVTDGLYQTAYRFEKYAEERVGRNFWEYEDNEEKSINEFDAQIADKVAFIRMYKGESFEEIVRKMAENK